MFTLAFWKATAERVVATFAVALLSVAGVGAGVLDLHDIQWGQALGIAGGAALLTLLKCLVAVNVGPEGSPSLVSDPAAAGLRYDRGSLPAHRMSTVRNDEAAERIAQPSNVTKVGGHPGSRSGLLPPPSTRGVHVEHHPDD